MLFCVGEGGPDCYNADFRGRFRAMAQGSGRPLREWAVRLALMLLGLITAHLGVSLFLLSRLGSDPFTIFVQGQAFRTGLSVGTCHVVNLCVLMLIMLLATRGYVKPGTVVCSFFGGPIIDFFNWLLAGWVSQSSAMPVRLAAMVAGCVILAAGMALVIKSDAGTGANDLVAVILTDKLKRLQFRWVRMGCDIFFAVAGFLLGGVVNIGTLGAVLLVGPVAQFFFPFQERLVSGVLRRFGLDGF